ncbi:MAG: phosphoribosylformimino-5-aminoimidazole carboxamide ribotide isomerase [Lachnospiraceae bacterium]|nr:phosphoribosylformimino-5-aminoimidazole carboxamide ribotide isomerase [Lachnospiraceae bacterium]
MEFRPCIDIHNGKVKQIVGGSLRDQGDQAMENFVSEQDAAFYAGLYRKAGIRGGHIILLNGADSEYYEATRQQALAALRAYPGGLQVGGGIHGGNAGEYLEAGASQVIVTSYVFHDGRVDYERLEELKSLVGRERLVLDLSCRKLEGQYRIVTDRWQKATQEVLTEQLLERLADYCCEFLVHAVDVEGKSGGIEQELAALLGSWGKQPITYAGGVHSYEDLWLLKRLGQDRLHVTIGSALDLFGGELSWERVLEICKEKG